MPLSAVAGPLPHRPTAGRLHRCCLGRAHFLIFLPSRRSLPASPASLDPYKSEPRPTHVHAHPHHPPWPPPPRARPFASSRHRPTPHTTPLGPSRAPTAVPCPTLPRALSEFEPRRSPRHCLAACDAPGFHKDSLTLMI
jgi:hypothetical protein